MKHAKSPPVELFLLLFPCGAYRCCRTRDGAKEEGQRMAEGRTCCERGHSSWEVHVYAPYGGSPRSLTAVSGLRLV